MQWVGLAAVSLPGLAALTALLFTWMQVGQASKELQISEQGQITNRFTDAITNLGSASLDVRLGGIYALERIMQDSFRDHPTVVSVLSAYAREHARLPSSGTKATSTEQLPLTDIQAVVSVLAHRPPGRDRGTVVDLSRTDLRGLKAMYSDDNINLRGALFTGSDLRDADLSSADLREASMDGANLTEATLSDANLRGAYLPKAILTDAALCSGETLVDPETGQTDSLCPDLTGVVLDEAILANAILAHVKLAGSSLANADLSGADLTGADLTDADLTGADLTKANLTDAHLTGVTFEGATLDGVRGLSATKR
ncbi:hypothetical protein GCM10009730_63020 [Streptomyces albidochromogenes]